MSFSLMSVDFNLSKIEPKTYLYIAGGVLAASLVTCGICKKLTSKRKKIYPKDVVIIHGAGRGPHCPSLSPFCVKIETYFRMNRIQYQNEKNVVMSSKGKLPWIEYNGEIVNDSSFIIQYFNKMMKIDLDRGLSDQEKAIARAFQKLTEENLFWGLAICRWVYEYTDNMWLGIGWFIPKMIRRAVQKGSYAAGMGRHSKEEILHIMEADLKALSDFLSNKKFMMGQDPTEVDCSIFGMLSQILWHSPGQPCLEWITDKYPNLKEYCFRMKDVFWKDWDECITHGGTREATR